VAKRATTNPLALAVLATLSQRPMHPYEMAASMRAQHYDTAVKLNYGSLYSVVESLHRAGCIDVEGVSRAGNRPKRTIYSVTPAGRAELSEWLGSVLGKPVQEYPLFVAGLAFMVALHPDDVRRHIAERADRLATEVISMQEALDGARRAGADGAPVPRVFLLEDEYQLRMRRAELEWVRELISDMDAGVLDGLEGWREYHQQADGPGSV
jgi:DNA-binding PadR family transcriptional regulator